MTQNINHAARWESPSRWYEANLCKDLFGEWTVIRAWGGKGSRRQGHKIDAVQSYEAGVNAMSKLDSERKAHRYASRTLCGVLQKPRANVAST